MRILIAPDKFKGCLTSGEVASALREGFASVYPQADFDLAGLADGGEGTAEIFHQAHHAVWREVPAHDPLGRKIVARYAWLKDRRLAVIPMSAASGLTLLQPSERNPLRTSTWGAGELIRDAIARGAAEIYVALGGSATTDAGAGMAAALGWQFRDQQGNLVHPVPENFLRICRIVPPPHPVNGVVKGLCDVDNPLLGEKGAARFFGPQKGATPEMVETLEAALSHFSSLCTREAQVDYRSVPGAGAAGGMGFGLLAFCGASLQSGVDEVASWLDLDRRIQAADLVVTGEGAIDPQTEQGKAPAGVAARARRYGKPVLAFTGSLQGRTEIFDAVIPIANGPLTLDESLSHAAILLRDAAVRAAQLLRISL